MHIAPFMLTAALLCLAWGAIAAEGPPETPLWPQGAPGASGNTEADHPSLTVCPVLPDKANGAAVIVCPGGGYGGLAMDHEGHQVAEWLNHEGINAFILKYRVAPYRHPIPLQDAQRAIRTVRANAAEWHIDPNHIGILGFSAGGHLVSTTGTHFDAGNANVPDPIDRLSSRPDFMILIYPVITFKGPFAHTGSMHNLLGPNPSPELIDLLSNELQVTPQTPPTFLVASSGDTGVPAENSVLFYLALHKAGVPAELHVYEKGEHGFGLGPNDPILSTWPRHCIDWMRMHGFLDRKH